MAKLCRTRNRVPYFKIDKSDYIRLFNKQLPICNNCLKSLIGMECCILLPLSSVIYCKECGIKILKTEKINGANKNIKKKKVNYYKNKLDI